MKIRLVTAMWGSDFVSLFLRLAVRSLLSDGNLADLAKAHQLIYTIYTTREDAVALEASPLFARLRSLVDVRISLFSPGEVSAEATTAHHQLWAQALNLAKRNKEALILIIPDILYGIGTLKTWADRLEQGYGAVYTPGPFVTLETTLAELDRRFPGEAEAISLPREEIHDLLLRHLHPLEACMLRDAPRRARHPEHDIRTVPGRGLVMRAFASQPFCINPANFDGLSHLNPEDHLDTICFEPCTTISVEPLLKNASWYYRPNPLGRDNLSNLGAWWSIFGTPAAMHESRFTYEFAVLQDPEWRHGSARVSAGGRMFRAQLRTASTAYKVWKEIITRGYHRAAGFLAAAQYAGTLRRHLVLPQGALLLIPADSAFSSEVERVLARQLALRPEKALIDLLKEHVLLPQLGSVAGRSWTNGKGVPLEDLAAHVAVTGQPFLVDGFTIYPIDRVLGVDLPMPAPAQPVVAVQPVPSSPEALAVASPALPHGLFGMLKAGRRNAVRRFVLWVERMPGGARPAAKLRRLVEIYTRERWQGIARRVYARVQRRRVVQRLLRLVSIPMRLLRRARHVARYVRRYGFSVAWQRYKMVQHMWLIALKDRLMSRTIPRKADLDLFAQAQQLRALEAVSHILQHYEKSLAVPDKASVPLGWARQRLHAVAPDAAARDDALERCLQRLVGRYSRWSEVWLELGCLQADLGRDEDALRSFTLASYGTRLSTSTVERDPRLVANAARAQILASRGRKEEAEEAFTMALAHGAGDCPVNLQYGYYLWSAGDARKALRHFTCGMEYDPVQWPLSRMPRDAAQLDFQLLTATSAS